MNGNLKKGYIQIYTGNGKGKSTAAIGLLVRAAGHGLKSYMLQFMKDFPYSEIQSLQKLDEFIKIKQIGKDDWVFRKEPAPEDEKINALSALEEVRKLMLKNEFDIIVLDEICVAIHFGLIKIEDVIEFMHDKPESVELILTGRYCPDRLIASADLVTEMREVKHYYTKGILSRKGIDS